MSDSPVPTGNIEPQKNIEITANGNYEVVPDDHYRGIAKVGINVFVDESGQYASGYTSGYTDGYTSGYTDGIVSGTSIGYDEGVAEQKAKLTGITITENGQYNRPDGYSDVTVNIPTGSTIHNQDKSITANTNGHQVVTFDSGYTGLGFVDIDVNVPTIGKIKSETSLSISPELRIYKSSTDYFEARQLNIGVSFDNIPTVKTKFMSVLGINFFIDANKISAECNKFGVDWSLDIFNGVNANVNYSLLFESDTWLIINGVNFGPDADDYYSFSYSGQTTIGSPSLVMDLNFFEYINENGVNTIIKDQMTESGVTFSGQILQPALSDGSFNVTGNGTYHFSKPDDGSYGMRTANVYVNVPIVPSWKNYQDDTFKFVREDCTNDGTYMCHIIDFDLSKFGAVDIVNGEITGATYQNMYQISNGHWYGTPTYNNVTYWLECWVDNGKLYWFCPNAIISRLDAYETGSNRQGWYLP